MLGGDERGGVGLRGLGHRQPRRDQGQDHRDAALAGLGRVPTSIIAGLEALSAAE
jgi:hypothetical protein